ncbi:MAG: LTA synthase family protein [Candidatus Hydrogenedens sp.]|nr:LTA synthase family protein [Candidatus Hydrogenedens sp.]
MMAFLALVAVVAGFVLFVILSLCGRRLRMLLLPLLAFLLLGGWAQSQLLNWYYGAFDGSPLDIALKDWRTADLLVWLVLAGLCVLTGIKKPGIFRSIFGLLIFLSLSNLAIALTQSRDMIPEEVVEEDTSVSWLNAFSFSKETNTVILLLDAFQSDYFNEYLEKNPDYGLKLPGFTYYPDTLATDYYTHRSLPVIMTGQHFKFKDSYQTYLKKAYENHSLPVKFREAGYSVGIYNYFTLAHSMYRPVLFESIADNYTTEAEEFTPYYGKEICQLLYTTLFQSVPHILKKSVYTRKILDSSDDLDRDVFRKTLKDQRRLAFSDPRFTFYHLQGLHDPLILDGKRVLDHRENVSQITEILADLIGDFIDSLQKLGIYDKSTIMILGDHGLQWKGGDMRFGAFDSEKAVTDPPLDLFAKKVRALPLLLFKAPGSREKFQLSQRRVSLLDVVPTLLDSAGLLTAEEYAGESLLQPENAQRVRYFFSSEYKNRGSAPLYEYAISGFSWNDASWNFTGNCYSSRGVFRTMTDNAIPGRHYYLGEGGEGLQFLDSKWTATEKGHNLPASGALITLPLAKHDEYYRLTLYFSAGKGSQKIHIKTREHNLGQHGIEGETALVLDISPEMIHKTRENIPAAKPPAKAHLAPIPQPSAYELLLDIKKGGKAELALRGFLLEERS